MKKLRVILASCLHFAGTRTFALGLLSIMTAAIVLTLSKLTGTVYIVDGDNTMVAYTARNSPAQILEVQGIAASDEDLVIVREDEDSYYSEIIVDRAFDVSLTAAGVVRTYRVTSGTVYTLLRNAGIEMDSDDIINLPLDKALEPNDHIIFKRVDIKTFTESEEIPFEVLPKSTSLLSKGKRKMLSPGKNGEKLNLYAEYSIDGVVKDRELISSDTIREPINQVTLVGDGSEISTLDFSNEFPLDANGIPLRYEYVIKNQVATGYSAGPRAYGASGMRCFAGTVAIRSSQFPYGTKFYIATADRKFVYGYAVANDTGTGLMQNAIDVDLFYPTYTESALNGRRIVDIYVLETPEQSIRHARGTIPKNLSFKSAA